MQFAIRTTLQQLARAMSQAKSNTSRPLSPCHQTSSACVVNTAWPGQFLLVACLPSTKCSVESQKSNLQRCKKLLVNQATSTQKSSPSISMTTRQLFHPRRITALACSALCENAGAARPLTGVDPPKRGQVESACRGRASFRGALLGSLLVLG